MQEHKGLTEDETVGWHHRLNGPEFEQTPGSGEEQGNLACWSPWGSQKVGWEMRWLDSIIDTIDMSLSKLRDIVKDRKPGLLQSWGSQKVGHNWVNNNMNFKVDQCPKYENLVLKYQIKSLACVLSSNFTILPNSYESINVGIWISFSTSSLL